MALNGSQSNTAEHFGHFNLMHFVMGGAFKRTLHCGHVIAGPDGAAGVVPVLASVLPSDTGALHVHALECGTCDMYQLCLEECHSDAASL